MAHGEENFMQRASCCEFRSISFYAASASVVRPCSRFVPSFSANGGIMSALAPFLPPPPLSPTDGGGGGGISDGRERVAANSNSFPAVMFQGQTGKKILRCKQPPSHIYFAPSYGLSSSPFPLCDTCCCCPSSLPPLAFSSSGQKRSLSFSPFLPPPPLVIFLSRFLETAWPVTDI